MSVRNLAFRAWDKLRSVRPVLHFHNSQLTVAEADERRSAAPGPLEEVFFSNQGRVAHKWIHYLPIYDRVFAPFRGTAVKMLEIGVFKGGSLDMWRNYFGREATLYGIDINPKCAEYVDAPNQVRIGSQDDPRFLAGVVSEMGTPDIILDDGSHAARHQMASFKALWPHLKPGGLYLIEDMHTSYWHELEGFYFDGGYRRPGTATEMIKALIDDMHGFYHGRPYNLVPPNEIGSLQVFDSIAVIEKADRLRPGHFQTGQGAATPVR